MANDGRVQSKAMVVIRKRERTKPNSGKGCKGGGRKYRVWLLSGETEGWSERGRSKEYRASWSREAAGVES